MAKIFVEVFREQVPISVRLEDITEYVKLARAKNCDEMRIIVSYDPANPGIELIFGRLEISTAHMLDAHLAYLKDGFDEVTLCGKRLLEYSKDEIKGIDFNSFMKRHPNLLKDSRKNGFGEWIPLINDRGFLKDYRSQRDWEREYLCMPTLPMMSFNEFYDILSNYFKNLSIRDKDRLAHLDPQRYVEFIDKKLKNNRVSLSALFREFRLENNGKTNNT